MKNIFKLRNTKFFAVGVIAVFAAVFMASCTSSDSSKSTTSETVVNKDKAVKTKTLDNLQAAFDGESNAHAKYLAFAKKADEEGYTKAGSLFRAVAAAEKIHFTNHSEVIRGMGYEPKAEIKLPEIKTTPENLRATVLQLDNALSGETYERDVMYPNFIDQARKDGNKEAVVTFNKSLTAETEHAKLYKDALAHVEELKGGTTDYYICPICGFTTTDATKDICPVTLTNQKYEKVS